MNPSCRSLALALPLAVLMLSTPARAQEVWNDTKNIANPDIVRWLQEKLPHAHLDAAQVPGRTVYARVRSVRAGPQGTGALVCEAEIGLTHEPSPGLRPREPSALFAALDRVPTAAQPDARQAVQCEATALRSAIDAAAKAPLDAFTRRLEATQEEGGGRQDGLQADASRARLYVAGLRPRQGTQAVMQALPDPFLAAYDYRRGAVVVLAQGFALRNRLVCFATAGLAARYPDGRNARVPAVSEAAVLDRALARGKAGEEEIEACRAKAAAQAISNLLDQRWDEEELFSDYAATREAGIELPDFAAVARAQPSSR